MSDRLTEIDSWRAKLTHVDASGSLRDELYASVPLEDFDWLIARVRELEAENERLQGFADRLADNGGKALREAARLRGQAAMDAKVVGALEDAHNVTLTLLSMFEKWAKYGDKPTPEEKELKVRRSKEAVMHWVALRDAALAARGKG